MAEFALRNLSVLAYAQGFTLWHVRHPGPLAETLQPCFLLAAAEMIETGDMVHVSADGGGAILFVKHSTGTRDRRRDDPSIVVEPMCATAGAGR